MTAYPTQHAAPLETPPPSGQLVHSAPAIPRGADPETAIVGPINGRYDLAERIAKGGMGIVYRAHDRLLNRTVAVKVMRGRFMDRPDLLRRFLAEARISGRLQHPGVVPVYEVGTLPDGRPFIAMKLIEGRTLARLLRDRKTPADNLAHFLKVFESLCQTVAYAHQQGVIHRDLKPDNVMVGEFHEVQVMDWGLAKFLDPADAVAPTPDGFSVVEQSVGLSGDGHTPIPEHLTHPTAVVPVGPGDPLVGYTIAGEVFGTLSYMPPEQARGESDRLDRRSDVFALGAILCEVLTGHPPYFGAPELLKEMAREGKLFGAFVLLDRCGADRELVRLNKRCLAAEQDVRPADAVVLGAMVAQCLQGVQDRNRQVEMSRLTAEARVAEAEERACLARRARRLARMLAVAGVMVAGLFASGLGWYANDRAARTTDEANRRSLALQQIVAALDEAEVTESEARRIVDRPFARDTAARSAVSDCKRAEILLHTVPNPPPELSLRLEEVKARVAATEKGTRLAVFLDRWQVDQFDGRGAFQPAQAAKACHDAFLEQGFDVLVMAPEKAAERIKTHSAPTTVREMLADWLAVTPNATERNRLASILREAGEVPPDLWDADRFGCTLAIHESAHRERPDHTLSDAWVKALDTEDAIELVRLADAIPASAVTAVGLAVVAQRLIEAKQSAAAERLLVRAVRRYPRDYVLNAHLGMLLKAKPNTHAEAIRYLTVARAARPADAVANAQLGAVLADAGRSDEAIDAYRRAYVAWPANDSIRRELARRVAAHGDECSIDYLKMVADDWPADADVLADLGEGQLRHGLFRAATVTLRAATDKLPAESPRRDGLLSAVRTAARLAALEDRIPDLQSGKYTPSSAGGWAQMGDVCARTKRYATAARFFRRAAELDEQFSLPAAKLAALAGFGQGTDAVELSEIERSKLRDSALAGFQRLGGIPSDPLLNALKDCVGDLPTDEQVVWWALWVSE